MTKLLHFICLFFIAATSVAQSFEAWIELTSIEKPSFMFSKGVSEYQFSFRDTIATNTDIYNTSFSTDSIYFIIPYCGKGTFFNPSDFNQVNFFRFPKIFRHKIADEAIIELEFLTHDPKLIISDEYIDDLNRTLRALYSGFSINITNRVVPDIECLTLDNFDINTIETIYGPYLDTLSYVHHVILSSENIDGFGAGEWYAGDATANYYFLDPLNFDNKWIFLHEIYHSYITGHNNKKSEVVVNSEGDSLVFLDFFGSIPSKFAHVKNSGRTIAEAHGCVSSNFNNEFAIYLMDTTLYEEESVGGNSDYDITCIGSQCRVHCKTKNCFQDFAVVYNNITPMPYIPAELLNTIENNLDRLGDKKSLVLHNLDLQFSLLALSELNKELKKIGHQEIAKQDFLKNRQESLNSGLDKVMIKVNSTSSIDFKRINQLTSVSGQNIMIIDGRIKRSELLNLTSREFRYNGQPIRPATYKRENIRDLETVTFNISN